MELGFKAVDAWVNPNLGPPDDASMNVGYLFPGLQERWDRGTTVPQLVEEMDAAGIDKAVLCSGYGGRDDLGYVIEAMESHPGRFAGSAVVDPRTGMAAVREVRRLAADHGFRMIRMLGFETGLAYDHFAYFPVYAACAELGLAVGLNVGISGPLVPSAEAQHPGPLDRVCHFFPELQIVMQHGGEPWEALCVKLMLKWDNLHYMTSAFAPRHIPKAILDFVNTRGAGKVMYASDYPLLGLERCTTELAELDLRDEERRRKLGRDNAERMFFAKEFA